MNNLGIVIAEERFARRAHTQAFLKLFRAAVRDPRHLWREALHMILFLLEQAFRNKQGHHHIFMPQRLETPIEVIADILPQRRAVRSHHHAAAHAGIGGKLRFLHNVRIPLGEIFLHGGNFLHHFLLLCHLPKNRLSRDFNMKLLVNLIIVIPGGFFKFFRRGRQRLSETTAQAIQKRALHLHCEARVPICHRSLYLSFGFAKKDTNSPLIIAAVMPAAPAVNGPVSTPSKPWLATASFVPFANR